jgi:hypothetical protein
VELHTCRTTLMDSRSVLMIRRPHIYLSTAS